jgi:hypothetical protein
MSAPSPRGPYVHCNRYVSFVSMNTTFSRDKHFLISSLDAEHMQELGWEFNLTINQLKMSDKEEKQGSESVSFFRALLEKGKWKHINHYVEF